MIARVMMPALLLSVVSLGCGDGGGRVATAPVTGKVVFDGKPVTGGSLVFRPAGTGQGEPGKPGSAEIADDGTFTVSTYGDGDGAVVGTHTVLYSAPPPKPVAGASPEDGAAAREVSPYEGFVTKTSQVTVEPAGTTIEIELAKP